MCRLSFYQKLIAKVQRIYKLKRNQQLKPIRNKIPIQLKIFKGILGLHSLGVCLPEIKIKLISAKKGAVKNESMVATLTKTAISDLKNNNKAIVPIERKVIQNQ